MPPSVITKYFCVCLYKISQTHGHEKETECRVHCFSLSFESTGIILWECHMPLPLPTPTPLTSTSMSHRHRPQYSNEKIIATSENHCEQMSNGYCIHYARTNFYNSCTQTQTHSATEQCALTYHDFHARTAFPFHITLYFRFDFIRCQFFPPSCSFHSPYNFNLCILMRQNANAAALIVAHFFA